MTEDERVAAVRRIHLPDSSFVSLIVADDAAHVKTASYLRGDQAQRRGD
jgi:hypothetical protein